MGRKAEFILSRFLVLRRRRGIIAEEQYGMGHNGQECNPRNEFDHFHSPFLSKSQC
jgi:hypothetical protein